MAKLIVRDNSGEHAYTIKGTVSIGRHPRSTICIHDPMVSKRHAIIRKVGSDFVYEDPESSNGSFFDGIRIYRHQFNDGDSITIGGASLTFFDESEEEKFAEMVNISQIHQSSQVQDRIEITTLGHFLPEREISDLNLLREDYEKLRLGHELLNNVGLDRDLGAVLERTCNELIRIFDADRCAIMLAHPGTGELVPKAFMTAAGTDTPLTISESVLREVRESKSAVLLADTSLDDRFSQASSLIMQGIRSVMCAPIMQSGVFFGVVHLDSRQGGGNFSRKDLQLLTGIVRHIAMTISNARLLKKIEHDAIQRAQFERLLSPSVAEQVLSGKVRLEKGGELRDLTILFADIRNFTGMTRRSRPTDVVAMLNRYFEMVVDIVFKYGGTVDKYIGDEIMVLFGAPLALERAPDRAVACALEMQAAMNLFNKGRMAHGDDPIEIGIGINSGEVVVGSIGSSRTMQYTCIGDAVNVASRLTHMARPGQVIASEQTISRLSGHARSDVLPPMALKGIEGATNAYLVHELHVDTDGRPKDDHEAFI